MGTYAGWKNYFVQLQFDDVLPLACWYGSVVWSWLAVQQPPL